MDHVLTSDQALLRLAASVRAAGYAFTTPTPATHALVNARPGHDRGSSLVDIFGWSRTFADLDPALFALMQQAGVLAGEPGAWRSTVRLSILDGMLFLHSAYPTRAADAVFFGPDTYRFVTALQAMPERAVRRAVDIGCGAGPGAAWVARTYPHAQVYGVDINAEALRLTRVNALLNDVRIEAVQSDLLTALDGNFDLIVANPPYLVDPGKRAYRDGGGPLGAGLSLAILDAACARLSPGGTLLLYTGAAVVNGTDPFHEAAAARLAGSGLSWRYREADPDVFGEELAGGAYAMADRIAAVVLTAHKGDDHA